MLRGVGVSNGGNNPESLLGSNLAFAQGPPVGRVNIEDGSCFKFTSVRRKSHYSIPDYFHHIRTQILASRQIPVMIDI